MKKQQWFLFTRISKTLTRSFCSQTTTSSSSFAVKKVTKSNFDSSLQELTHHVRAADFVSIDLEMTGITSAPWREHFEFDRSDVRYLKVKDSVEKFAVVQFGICPFRWDSDKHSFIAQPYTFYVFPRKELPLDGPAYEFLCQTTSLDFLARYQFDFNACIYEGISYLSRAQEGEALNQLLSEYEEELPCTDVHLKEDEDIPPRVVDILFSERMKNRISEWRDGLLRNTGGKSQFQGTSVDSKAQLQIVFFKMHPALELNGFTSHQLRLIQLVIRKLFRDLIFLRLNGENSLERKLVVYTDSDDEKISLMKEMKDNKRKELQMKVKSAVGFRHVIDLLSSEKKLVVGHNCFLGIAFKILRCIYLSYVFHSYDISTDADVAHIHSKFLGPLPSTIEDFASSVHKHFPEIIDTKYLMRTDNVLQCMMNKNSTSLSKAFTFLCPQVSSVSRSCSAVNQALLKFEVQVDEMRSSNWNSGAKHEAGYDAFMTGCVFAQACSHLGVDFELHSSPTGIAHNEKIQKYTNLLYVSWRNGSIIDLVTGKETPDSFLHKSKMRYPKVIFQNVVVLWGFSSNVKPGVLKDCLSKVFGLGSVTSIYYLDSTAAFIQFSNKGLVSDFLVLKEMLENNNDAVSVLHPLQQILEGGHTRAADYEAYKEICSSSLSKVMFADQANSAGIKKKVKEEAVKEDTESQEKEILDVTQDTCDSDIITKNRKETSIQFSCVELMDALCRPEAQVGNRNRTSNT